MYTKGQLKIIILTALNYFNYYNFMLYVSYE
jgi:hypothetical protein